MESDSVQILKEAWNWVGLDPALILAENDFGNLLIKDTGGKIWRLCPEEASCKRVAESEADLHRLMSKDDFRVDWEMKRLVDAATASLGPLPTGKVLPQDPRCIRRRIQYRKYWNCTASRTDLVQWRSRISVQGSAGRKPSGIEGDQCSSVKLP